jgi:hypothetical protein
MRLEGNVMNVRFVAIVLSLIVLVPGSLAARSRESATFRAVVSGGIIGGPQSHVNSITSSTARVVIRLMPMELSLLIHSVESGSSCFQQANYEGPLTVETRRDGTAQAQYFFTARAADGVTDVRYVLDMHGPLEDGSNWLPLRGTTARMIVGEWSVAAESKGTGGACKGSGTVHATILEVERLP